MTCCPLFSCGRLCSCSCRRHSAGAPALSHFRSSGFSRTTCPGSFPVGVDFPVCPILPGFAAGAHPLLWVRGVFCVYSVLEVFAFFAVVSFRSFSFGVASPASPIRLRFFPLSHVFVLRAPCSLFALARLFFWLVRFFFSAGA